MLAACADCREPGYKLYGHRMLCKSCHQEASDDAVIDKMERMLRGCPAE